LSEAICEVDQAYGGAAFAAWVASHRKTGTLRVEVIPRLKDQRGFTALLAKRWINERTFGRFMKHRCVVQAYETKIEHAEAPVHTTMTRLTLHRLI
jgi:transposase